MMKRGLRLSMSGSATVGALVLLAGAAATASPQQVVVQSGPDQAYRDQMEANGADADRRAAERVDRTRREAERNEQMEREFRELDDLSRALDEQAADIARENLRQEIEQQNREEMAEWQRVEQNRHASCMITLDDEKKMMIETIRRQYDGMIAQLRAGGADGEVIAGLQRARDTGIAGVTDGACQSAGEERFAYERQRQIEEMQRTMQERGTTEMPPFVIRSDGSIGPKN